MNKHIEEGRGSFCKNRGRYKNPYKKGTRAYDDFERGWLQALKRSPDSLLKKYWSASV